MPDVRDLIISVPLPVVAGLLLVLFCLVSTAARQLVRWCCDQDAREELVDQAKSLLTGVSATFALFVGFAISMCWGAVTAAQNAAEQQAAAVLQMAWELRSIPDQSQATLLTDKLTRYAVATAEVDGGFLARGRTADLPSAAALKDFENALNGYVCGPGSVAGAAGGLPATASKLVASAATVSAVANRALPRPLANLLACVSVLVTIVLGITTVSSGRSSMLFVYVWCLIPALSLTVVLALAFPFALRSSTPLAPLRALADNLAG